MHFLHRFNIPLTHGTKNPQVLREFKLSLIQQDEREDYFNQYKAACSELVAKIAETDKEIDTRIYALYGLKEEELKIVEG